MTFCPNCGREIHDHCICLKDNKIPKYQIYMLFGLTLSLPVILIKSIQGSKDIFNLNYIFIGGLCLSIIIVLLTILEFALKKSYLALFFGCHQNSRKSFKIQSYVFPICSRCSGIYLGVLVFTVLNYFYQYSILLNILLGLPLVLDGIIQYKGIKKSNNIRRVITGFLFGTTLITLFSLYNVLLIYCLDYLLFLVNH
jgi:uncharacterized membrane protein